MTTVARAGFSGLESILELEQAGFPDGQRWSAQAWEAEIEEEINAGRDVFVALDGDRVTGALAVRTVEDVADLLRVVVDPGYRRHGVATALIGAGVRAAHERGARQMMLEVRWDNDAAIACYQRFGFEQLGSRRDYYGPGKDALILKLYDLANPWPPPPPGRLPVAEGRTHD